MLLTLGFSSMSLADIVWAMSKVDGSYIPGSVSDVHLPVLLRLARSSRARATAWRAVARADAHRAHSARALIQGMPYIAMMVSFMVLVYVESSTATQPREYDDRSSSSC